MLDRRTIEEGAISSLATVLPTDTLLYALRVMERHQVRLLLVVEETGALLGLISEAHLLAAWRADPLLPVGEVMAAYDGLEKRPEHAGVRLLRAAELLDAEPEPVSGP